MKQDDSDSALFIWRRTWSAWQGTPDAVELLARRLSQSVTGSFVAPDAIEFFTLSTDVRGTGAGSLEAAMLEIRALVDTMQEIKFSTTARELHQTVAQVLALPTRPEPPRSRETRWEAAAKPLRAEITISKRSSPAVSLEVRSRSELGGRAVFSHLSEYIERGARRAPDEGVVGTAAAVIAAAIPDVLLAVGSISTELAALLVLPLGAAGLALGIHAQRWVFPALELRPTGAPTRWQLVARGALQTFSIALAVAGIAVSFALAE